MIRKSMKNNDKSQKAPSIEILAFHLLREKRHLQIFTGPFPSKSLSLRKTSESGMNRNLKKFLGVFHGH